ncbi:tubulin epsilon and delta complex protein 2 isoform X2 [Sarcophilus harrisii]|uniref:tubulin epsilon and delta complex protein 2 isoform X2 n=1 Tax=Sarcophilus harrisii TaxID=9305 RepID=UPI001301F6BE|nr:tubulin epsilon and delta complex protein 2 isoform X2 [Sarcophilus harrisii]
MIPLASLRRFSLSLRFGWGDASEQELSSGSRAAGPEQQDPAEAGLGGGGGAPNGPRQFSRRAGAAGVCLCYKLPPPDPCPSPRTPAMLPAACSHRLVTEIRAALTACQEKEKELEQSLARCRVLLQPWEGPSPPGPEPAPSTETKSECEPTPKDLKELELLTQALEKALRVRKGISQVQAKENASGGRATTPLVTAQADAGARPRTSNPKASVPTKPPAASQRAKSRVKKPARTSSNRGRALTLANQPHDSVPMEGPAQPCPLPPQGQVPELPTPTPVSVLKEAGATGPNPRPEQAKIQPGLAPEAFLLKDKGTQLQLPLSYKKIASRNSSLWAQVQHLQSNPDPDVAAAKARFLERMKGTFDLPSPSLSLAKVQEEVSRLDQACHILTQHLEETLEGDGELSAASLSWEQEYRRLVTLEGLQAAVKRHLLKLQELREGYRPSRDSAGSKDIPEEYYLGSRTVENFTWDSPPCLGGKGLSGPTNRLVYSSVQELQTMTALKLHVTMLKQQIHLQKVMMEEFLPLVRSETPADPAQLALYRAIHSQLCEAGECFSVLVRDEPSV